MQLDVPSSPPEGEATSGGLSAAIWNQWRIIVICLLASLISGLVYLSRTPRTYESSSTILLQQSVPKVISDAVASSSNTTGYLNTQCEIIRSTTILTAALDGPLNNSIQALRTASDQVLYLKDIVAAEPDKDGDAIVVSVICSDPNDAAVIANGVVSAYLSFQIKQNTSTADQVSSVLSDEMQRRENELAALHKQILESRSNPDVGRVAIESGKLTALSNELTQQHEHTIDLKFDINEAGMVQDDPVRLVRLISKLSGEDSAANYSQTIIDPMLLFQYRDAQRKLSELIEDQGLDSSNPVVETARNRLQRLEGEMGKAASEVKDQLVEETDESVRKEATLQQQLEVEQEFAAQNNSKAAEFDELNERAQRIERAIDVLDTQIKQVNVTEDVAGRMTASVLEPAKAELAPIGPRRASTMGISIVVGLALGLGVGMCRELADQHLRSAHEVISAFQLPILGVVPSIRGKKDVELRGRVMALKPHSVVAETYRSLRISLDFGQYGPPPRTLLFTSPGIGDGKTTSCSNLAVAFARSGRRVLLIDADCRKPMVHRVFGVYADVGISNVLEGKLPWEQAVRSTDVPGLDILPCGPLPENPSELLTSTAMVNLLEQVSKVYDRVLLDSSPLGAVSDARVLAGRADATVLVVREGRCVRAMAELARDALQSVGANVLGVVINDSRRRHGGYTRYSGNTGTRENAMDRTGVRWQDPGHTSAFSPIAIDRAQPRSGSTAVRSDMAPAEFPGDNGEVA
jgi:capsular exopolysaccharide synthesis family protein